MQPEGVEIWSIAQLTRRVKNLLEQEVGGVWVSGEISNWKVAGSGHAYFTLKDDQSQIDAVMFRGSLRKLRFEPEPGLEVIAHGRVTVYERRGNYQIVLDDMQPRGMGALQLAFEKLKAKLQEEGLFDESHKKPLPMLPKRIGVVTSRTGAAIRDILHVIERRFAQVHVVLYPTRVQGEGAAKEIAAGIRALDRYGVDVMIVGRGGGSLEDLWPFNEEAVVRAVFAARTPVISAVGHEVDFALTDFAADVRAPTPSAAAELVVRERQALGEQMAQLRRRLAGGLERWLEQHRHRLGRARGSFVFERPEELVRQHRQALDELRMRAEMGIGRGQEEARIRVTQGARALALLAPARQVAQARERLASNGRRLCQTAMQHAERKRGTLRPLAMKLDALSPLAILRRGYALAWKLPDRTLVRSVADIAVGDAMEIRLGRGRVEAVVKETKGEDDAAEEERA